MNIYVGNLSSSSTEEELRDIFAEYGEVSSVNIITDKRTGNQRVLALSKCLFRLKPKKQ